jgi:hypothetical protein
MWQIPGPSSMLIGVMIVTVLHRRRRAVRCSAG